MMSGVYYKPYAEWYAQLLCPWDLNFCGDEALGMHGDERLCASPPPLRYLSESRPTHPAEPTPLIPRASSEGQSLRRGGLGLGQGAC